MTAISVFLLLCLAGVFVLAMRRASIWTWTVAAAAAVLIWRTGLIYGNWHEPAFNLLGILAWVPVVVLAGLAIPALRRAALIGPLFHKIKGILPRVSATEQEALNAGTIGFDAELFSGQPNWEKLRAVPPITLTEEEKAFLDGPTTELCRMVNDWMIRHQDKEIPEEVWAFVKKHGFLGMLISKEHGGLGFSPQAQSLVLGKIASRSPDAVTIVMVPNSLGPGELIEKYGTPEQKHYYLPRLAKGLEVPCFSLTGPTSGSDAATMRDVGYVTRGRHEGQDVVGIRVSWDKRYITLGPVATLVGLAFRLFDPENVLGRGEDIGITVALVPANHPGVHIGRRHLPSGTGFPNGPNWGKDVFIPMDWVIGGDKMAGQGWRMLMECLAAGRSISLPSSSAAGAKSLLRNTSAYARIRKQFDLPIGKMEGLEEPLARMVEVAYVNEAARGVTASMVSRGEKPSVISAIMKYQTTERMRRSLNDAMDLHGGRAICDGPTNYIMGAYQAMPVAITVEGANILTRSLITFAQGALRSHPYLYQEIQACQDADTERGLAAVRRGVLRPRLLLALEHLRFVLPQHYIRAVRPRAGEGLRHGRMVPAAVARLAQLRAGRRPDGRRPRRRAQDQAEDHGPPRRRAVRALSAVLRAQALRGRRQARQRPPHRGLRRPERPLPLPGGAARHHRQLPRRAGALADARLRLPAGSPLQAGTGLAGPQGGRAGADPRRGARPPHPLHLRLPRCQRPHGIAGGHADQGGGRRGRREEARPRGAGGPGATACTAPTGSATRPSRASSPTARRNCCARSSS